jgi:ATP-binding cassette subfamily F protein uup
MLEPADVLFLDEPTNDLDIQTLEVIEESLQDFTGAVVLISHDRCLMDRVCTKILALSGNAKHHFYADYSQWENAEKEEAEKKSSSITPPSSKIASPSRTKKLSYKEQKELENMEGSILSAEEGLAALHSKLENPEIHADPEKSMTLYQQIAAAEQHLNSLFERWEFLQTKAEE